MLIVLAVVRTLIGLSFVAGGIAGFVARDFYVETFTHWQIPYPDFSVPIFAAIAGVCGGLLTIGWLVRPAALALATILVEVMITGGRVDGEAYVIAPLTLFAVLVFYAWRSGRYPGWAPTRRPGTQ